MSVILVTAKVFHALMFSLKVARPEKRFDRSVIAEMSHVLIKPKHVLPDV